MSRREESPIGHCLLSSDESIPLTEAQRSELESLRGVRRPGDLVHRLRGQRTGRLQYVVKHGLSEYLIDGPTSSGERTTVGAKDIGTPAAVLSLRNSKSRQLELKTRQRLGIRGGHVEMRFEGLGTAVRRDIELHTTRRCSQHTGPILLGYRRTVEPGAAGRPVSTAASRRRHTHSVPNNRPGAVTSRLC